MTNTTTICPGCGVELPAISTYIDVVYNESIECQALYNELSLYTLSHDDTSFIHQYVVDAYTAQHAGHETKPIAVLFALVGLYLHIEKNYSGKEVQYAHMRLAEKKTGEWPKFPVPIYKGNITILHVMNAKPGAERDDEIEKWSRSVWQACSENHHQVKEFLRQQTGI